MSCPRGAVRHAVALSLACVLALSCCASGAARPTRIPPDPWKAANNSRVRFEAQPSHSRLDYDRMMAEFRAIYHSNPADVHAAAAVRQVAELLAEQGRELHDAKSLRDGAGQYEFLAKEYPASMFAAPALASEVELFGPEGLGDVAEARRVSAELKKKYPLRATVLFAKKTSSPLLVGRNESVVPVRKPMSENPAVGHPASATPRAKYWGPSPAAQDDGEKQKTATASVGSPVAHRPIARVTGIRHWSTASYTRVAIDLGDEVEYQAARVEHPDRIFFDLHHAHLAPELIGKSFAVTDDGFLTRIRAAQYSDDVTRVVLDVHEVTDYSAFLLPNPYRLIIDIHGK
ncbi:MAG: AMIN domain-containing protein, partial [Acidobacteriaceae bacterium]